jgi:type IV pilus assembly protein PilN
MRISLNLATRPYADLRPALKRLRIAMAVLAGIALGLGLGLHAIHQKAEAARASEQSVQSRIDAISREGQSYQDLMRQPANAQLLAQAAMLNQLFDEKTFSWTLAMEDLETVLPGGVQVTQIEPKRTKDGHITLSLRVVGPRDSVDDLVQNLEHSKHFLLPHIVGESSESIGGQAARLEPLSASNRFTFELLAEYNAAARVDRKAQKKQKDRKPSASGERGIVSAPHMVPQAQAPAASRQKPIPPPHAGPGRSGPQQHRLPNPNPGGQR